MLRADYGLLAVFWVAALAISGFVYAQIWAAVEDSGMQLLLTVVFAAAMLVLSGGMLWVAVHLHKNQEVLYERERYYRELASRQKGENSL